MRLNPDLELLERIGILSNPVIPLHRGGYQMEVEETDFKSLSPFLIRWGAGEALQELLFFQVNFVEQYKPLSQKQLKAIQEDRIYFQSREKLAKMDYSQLKGIKLNFGKNLNADLPPELVSYFGAWIKKNLFAEASLDPDNTEWEEYQTDFKKVFKRYKKQVNQLQNSKLKIQKALPNVEVILKGKSPEATFTKKQIMLCTYGIFYQRGHRLDFKDHKGTEPESPERVFEHETVYGLIKSHLPKDLSWT